MSGRTVHSATDHQHLTNPSTLINTESTHFDAMIYYKKLSQVMGLSWLQFMNKLLEKIYVDSNTATKAIKNCIW